MKTCKGNVDDKVFAMKSEIAELRHQLSTLLPSNNTNNGTYYNAPVTNNITIQVTPSPPILRNFGKDNLDAVPEEFLENAIMNLQIRELIEELHFDPNYPENHNVRLTSLKRNLMQMYINDKWQTIPMLQGINDLISQATDIFLDYYKKNTDIVIENIGEEEANKLLRRLRDLEAMIQDKFRKGVTKNLEGLMIDKRKAIVTR